jgi:hypothetical protein
MNINFKGGRMDIFKQKNKLIIFCMFLFFTAQGCVAKKETITLMPGIKEPVACSDMLLMNTGSIPYNNFILALDNSYSGYGFDTCWKPLMKKALKDGRNIPAKHLARAVHVFNRNDSKDEFSAAVYLYFKAIINGNDSYGDKERKLLAQYLSFTINNAGSKQDERLEKAKLVCSRLDPELYGKYFR